MKIFVDGNKVIIRAPEIFGFDLRNEFREAVRAYPVGTPYDVDLQKVVKLDSSALGMLLLLREHASGANSTVPNVILKGARPEILKLLRLVNFQELFAFV